MGSTLFHNARKVDAAGIVDGFWMLVRGDTIAATGSSAPPPADTEIDLGGRTITPGFVDLHCHGGGGATFDDGPEEIERALATHRAHGTTRSLISLVSNPVARMRESLAVVKGLTESDPLVLGSHLEGPYLADARRGAHNPEYLHAADAMELDTLIEAGAGTIRQVTLAPERPGALEAIDRLVSTGVAVGIGHTEADYSKAREAFDRGATLLTHAFNAMPGIRHRAPGPIIAAFTDERVMIEVILDGIHVHPEVAEMAFRSAPGRIALVTDAMAAAGSSDGDYRLGSLNVSVREGKAMLSGTTTIAGSTLTQDAALRCAMDSAGVDPVAAVMALTLTPASAIGMGDRLGMLEAGYAADAVIFDAGWNVASVWAAGQQLS